MLTQNPDIFCICLMKQKFLVWYKHTFYLLWTLPFLRIFKEIENVSLKKCAKRGGVIKDKMWVFTIQETFVLSSICKKCQGTKIKAVLWSQSPSLFHPPFNSKHKNAFIWVPWLFWHMLEITKVSCLIKIHILFFMIPTLFACILRDICYLLKYAQGRGHKR